MKKMKNNNYANRGKDFEKEFWKAYQDYKEKVDNSRKRKYKHEENKGIISLNRREPVAKFCKRGVYTTATGPDYYGTFTAFNEKQYDIEIELKSVESSRGRFEFRNITETQAKSLANNPFSVVIVRFTVQPLICGLEKINSSYVYNIYPFSFIQDKLSRGESSIKYDETWQRIVQSQVYGVDGVFIALKDVLNDLVYLNEVK